MEKQRPDYKEVVASMIDLIQREYSHLGIKLPEFERVKEILEVKVSDIQNNTQMRDLAVKALSEFRDCHLRVIDGTGNSKGVYGDKAPKNFQYELLRKYVSDFHGSGPISVGKIDDIFYVWINSFGKEFKPHFDKIYSQPPPDSQKKFVVDLRANSGGSDNLGLPLVRFIQGSFGPIISHYLRYRTDEQDPTKLTEFIPQYLNPEITFLPKRDAIVLIGNKTCSSAELTTMRLAAIPGTVLIGDTTHGGSGCPQRYLVDGPNKGRKIKYIEKPLKYNAKFALDIPSWIAYKIDQTLLMDQNGINPHILIPTKESIIDGRDMVLEKAIEVHQKGYIG